MKSRLVFWRLILSLPQLDSLLCHKVGGNGNCGGFSLPLRNAVKTMAAEDPRINGIGLELVPNIKTNKSAIMTFFALVHMVIKGADSAICMY